MLQLLIGPIWSWTSRSNSSRFRSRFCKASAAALSGSGALCSGAFGSAGCAAPGAAATRKALHWALSCLFSACSVWRRCASVVACRLPVLVGEGPALGTSLYFWLQNRHFARTKRGYGKSHTGARVMEGDKAHYRCRLIRGQGHVTLHNRVRRCEGRHVKYLLKTSWSPNLDPDQSSGGLCLGNKSQIVDPHHHVVQWSRYQQVFQNTTKRLPNYRYSAWSACRAECAPVLPVDAGGSCVQAEYAFGRFGANPQEVRLSAPEWFPTPP